MLETLRKVFFGDDVFISYCRADGGTYAASLASRLAVKRLSCRFDQWGSSPGRVVPPNLMRALKRSGILVVVSTKGAGRSDAVTQEIREFAPLDRLIIPIDLDGTIREASWWPLLEGLAISEDFAGARLPSDRTVDRVLNSINFTTRNQRLQRLSIGALILFVVLVTASLAATLKATTATRDASRQRADRDAAVNERLQAEHKVFEANNAVDRAKNELASTETQRRSAEEARDTARREAQLQLKIALARRLGGTAASLRQRAITLVGRSTLGARYETASSLFEASELLGIKALDTWRAFDVMGGLIETQSMLLRRVDTKYYHLPLEHVALSRNGRYVWTLGHSWWSALDRTTHGAPPIDDWNEAGATFAFSANGNYVAAVNPGSSSEQGRIGVFDLNTARLLGSVPLSSGHFDVVLRAVSPGGRFVAMSYKDVGHSADFVYKLGVYATEGQYSLEIDDYQGSVGFATDDTLIVASSRKIAAVAVDIRAGKLASRWVSKAAGADFLVSPDGRWAATRQTKPEIVRTSDGSTICSVDSGRDRPTLQFSRNGSRIAIANGESIVIYDVESCHALSSIRFSSTTRIRLAFSDDGDWLAAGGDDPGVYVFDSEAGTLLAVITNAYSEGLAFGADGTSLAVGEWEGKSFSSAVHIYETVQAPYRLPMARHDDQASFSRDGNLLVLYGKEDLPLRVVDVRARKIVSSVPITGSFETFHFGADDTVYALEYPVGALRTFDYRTGRERPSQNGHGYHDYVFRPESGDWAATDAQRLSVHVGRSKAMDIRLDGYGGHPLDLSRSGRFVTIGGAVFDVGQGQKTGQIAEANVFAVFIDPDDRFVISGSADGDVIVTDLASATRLYRYALGRDVFIVAVGLSQSRSEILIAYKHSFLGLGIYLRALPWADPVSIAASACTWTTRDLNDTERSSYLDHSRQTICAH